MREKFIHINPNFLQGEQVVVMNMNMEICRNGVHVNNPVLGHIKADCGHKLGGINRCEGSDRLYGEGLVLSIKPG